MHFSIERIWLNSYLQLVGENLTKVFIIHLINMHFNLLSLKIYHKLLFYYIQIQKFMPFNKGFFYSHPIRTSYEAMACDENPWYVSKQPWKAAWMWTPGTQWHIPGRAGEPRSPYQGKFTPVRERKNNSMIYYPIAVQCCCNSKPSENRRICYQRKIKSSFLNSFSSFPPFSPEGLGQPQEGPARLAGTPALPRNCHPDCRHSLQSLPASWSSGLRVQIHLYTFIVHFSLPSMCHMQGKCSGGSKYGDVLSYLARTNSYIYFRWG